ncbi:MAG: nuclear transport factor 2 family protein [Chloroflexi bacterium]|nr:nuclear transport factor 2 family protein [Chloroflexota bacterium]
MSTKEETTATTVRAVNEALNARDREATVALFATDGVFGQGAAGARFEAPEAVADALFGFLGAHESGRFETVHEVFAGDEAYKEWKWVGVTNEGEPAESHGCDYYLIRDGKVAVMNTFSRAPIQCLSQLLERLRHPEAGDVEGQRPVLPRRLPQRQDRHPGGTRHHRIGPIPLLLPADRVPTRATRREGGYPLGAPGCLHLPRAPQLLRDLDHQVPIGFPEGLGRLPRRVVLAELRGDTGGDRGHRQAQRHPGGTRGVADHPRHREPGLPDRPQQASRDRGGRLRQGGRGQHRPAQGLPHRPQLPGTHPSEATGRVTPGVALLGLQPVHARDDPAVRRHRRRQEAPPIPPAGGEQGQVDLREVLPVALREHQAGLLPRLAPDPLPGPVVPEAHGSPVNAPPCPPRRSR